MYKLIEVNAADGTLDSHGFWQCGFFLMVWSLAESLSGVTSPCHQYLWSIILILTLHVIHLWPYSGISDLGHGTTSSFKWIIS